ncbi:MAG: hypothetical protein CBC34_011660 [Hyphomicrobiaceae bacterium TMED74]|nr:hypothetical protein [Filomicrobium sp.]RPG40831.1 MAG: hypothetical protein CBC34_011660 [Hyphomicrobiaceae bacterium TMED74]
MTGLTVIYSLAPRVLALTALVAAFAVGSLLSEPELLMRTALTAPLPSGQILYDEVADQPDLEVSKLLAEHSSDELASSPRIFSADLYGHVARGDRIPVALAPNKLGLIDVTDVRELGKLIVPGSGQQVPGDYLLLTGRVVGSASSEIVRLVVNANAKPPFNAIRADDRRSL